MCNLLRGPCSVGVLPWLQKGNTLHPPHHRASWVSPVEQPLIGLNIWWVPIVFPTVCEVLVVQAKNKTWTVVTCEATSNQLDRWCLDVESGKYKGLHRLEEVRIPYKEFSGLPNIRKSGFSLFSIRRVLVFRQIQSPTVH